MPIHTVATNSDASFEFSLDMLQQYVDSAQLDAIAITNHNLFDRNQFELIRETLVPFPVREFRCAIA